MSKQLFKSTSLVSILTLLSRLIGFLRENVFAIVFGAGAEMDAFVIAFRIPNFLRKIFAEGAFSQAFMPVLKEVKVQQSHQELKELIARVAGTLGLILLVVSVLGVLASPLWAFIFAPAYVHDPEKFSTLNHLLRVMFPYIFFISMTGLAGSIQNAFKQYAVPAVTPLVLSLSMGWAAVSFSPYFKNQPIEAVAWGVMLAGVLQLLLQIPFLWRLDVLVWPKWGWRDPNVRRIMRMMLPALFGVSVAQIGMLLDSMYATFLPTGSVSWLYYADRLMQFPLGVFGIALATVVMPHLSEQMACKNEAEFKRALDWALKLIVMVASPCAVGLAVLAGPILVTLFQYGHFNFLDVRMTEESLWAFSAGLFFFIMVKIVVSAFYSRQDMKTPVKIGMIAVGVNIVFNTILIFPLHHVGLALATSIAAMFNSLALLFILYKQNLLIFRPGWRKVLLGSIVGNILMVLVVHFLQGNLQHWVVWHPFMRVLHLFLLMGGGVLIYFLSLAAFGVRRGDFII
ncbi:MAG: murein biosynthesis integral membrane protein MurJ [Gammaproteobacteria bacterium]|nr:murein biosynthesis integral membrane protein MurJ [Gammaproteobacteria bacterium]